MKKIKDCVVKRKGHTEHYDEKKVYASVYSAALSCHYSETKSEKIADKITSKINSWIKSEVKKKKCVLSYAIRDKVYENLNKIDKDVALMYKHHLDLS